MFWLIMARILWLSMVSPFLSVKFLAEMSANLLIKAMFGSWGVVKNTSVLATFDKGIKGDLGAFVLIF